MLASSAILAISDDGDDATLDSKVDKVANIAVAASIARRRLEADVALNNVALDKEEVAVISEAVAHVHKEAQSAVKRLDRTLNIEEWMINVESVSFRGSDDRLLGRGASGKVFRGEMDGRSVAVKVFDLSGTSSLTVELNIAKEIEAWRLISDHQSIVSLLGVCTKVQYFIVSEYCENGNSREYLQRLALQGRDERWRTALLNILAESAEALQYMHSKDLIHRDVKAANIFVRKDGSAAVGDFGLSRAVGRISTTSNMAMKGTLNWCSPEQLTVAAWDLTAKTDTWSLGMTIYELLANKDPYKEFHDSYQVRLAITADESRLPIMPDNQTPSTGEAQMTATPAQGQFAQLMEQLNQTHGQLPSGWEMRITNNNRAYFVDHNSKITTWDDPRLSSSLDKDVQFKRDFRRKLVYIWSQPAMRPGTGQCHITVRRNNIFADAFAEIMSHPASDLKKKLFVKFHGEDGLNYENHSGEFFYLVSKEMLNSFYCLFEHSALDNNIMQINPHSGANPEHLKYFKFIGRVVGLGIFHRRLLDAFFVPAFYKMIIRKSITLEDMESVDAVQFRSLQWMLDNEIDDVLDLTFALETDVFGQLVEVELKEGGKDIVVTDDNKREYVRLVTEWRISRCVEEQFRAFQQGFIEIVSQDLISVFDERELELLIGGLAEIDVDDWKKHTNYRGYSENDETIQDFWKASAVRSWDNEKKTKLLRFVTGTSRIPVNGFEDLQGGDGPCRFTIEKTGTPEHLPISHTCFNRLDLPPYRTYDQLDSTLTMAIEGNLGFLQE
ncbi:hypothetical protein HK405_001117 [Cladochytrium tenue]|nr:hypothetical protein HK405_001117 [Cladochytrium tenue]